MVASSMIYSTFLPRCVSQGGCIVAGTRVATAQQKLKDEKIKLLAKPDTAVQKVIDSTRAIEALTTTDAAMLDIDRGTDRSIAGFHDELDAIERCLDRGDILPLTEAQSARLADATTVRGTLLADGTYFLKLPYSQQWVPMSNMVKAMDEQPAADAIERLGLTPEADRVKSSVALYGAKLGVTETRSVDPAARAIDAWHEAMGELMVRVHDAYDDPNDPTHKKVREALTAPYHLTSRGGAEGRPEGAGEEEGAGAAGGVSGASTEPAASSRTCPQAGCQIIATNVIASRKIRGGRLRTIALRSNRKNTTPSATRR